MVSDRWTTCGLVTVRQGGKRPGRGLVRRPSPWRSVLGVAHKTVERWIAGRVPYRRTRYAIAAKLGVDETYLWPDALSREQVTAASEGELLTVGLLGYCLGLP
jgi:hypothetical protein